MALVSPPKPWQRSQADPASSPASPPITSSPTREPVPAPAPQPMPISSILSPPGSFGYGQSSMGYSPSYMSASSYPGSAGYGSSGMYGGGYGSSSYGTGSSYGSPYSSMQSNQWGLRPYNSMPFPAAGHQLDAYKGTPVNALVHSGHAFMSGMQQHVSTFGRFSQILHMNLDALQMSFSSILQLLTNASMLRHELSAFFGTFGSIRAIYLLYVKLRHMILRLLGRSNDARKLEFEGLWQDSGQGRWGWMPTFLTLSVALLILRKLVQFLSSKSSSPSSANMRPDPDTTDPSQGYWRTAGVDPGNCWPSSPAQSGYHPAPFLDDHWIRDR